MTQERDRFTNPAAYGQMQAEVREAYPDYEWEDPSEERASHFFKRPTSVTEGVGSLEERYEQNPYDLPRQETANIDELIAIVERWARARAMGREDEADALEYYLTGGHGFPLSGKARMQIAGAREQGPGAMLEPSYAPSHDFSSLSKLEKIQFNRAVYNIDDVPTFLLLNPGDADLSQLLREGTADDIRAEIENLSEEDFATFEKEQLDTIDTGLYPDLLQIFSNTDLVTSLGIFTEKAEVEVDDFFDEPGALGQYASLNELETIEVLRESEDVELTTRSALFFIYKFFQAHPEMSAEDVSIASLIPGEELPETSALFLREYEEFLGFVVDMDSLSEGGILRRQSDPAVKRLFEGLESDLVRQVGKIVTTPEWLAGPLSALDEFAPINTVTQSQWGSYLSDVNRELVGGTGEENQDLLDFIQSKQNEYTEEYAKSGSDLSFREWAANELTPELHTRMADEQEISYQGYDEIIDPIIRSMLGGMPSSNALDARLLIKDMLIGLRGANNVLKKSDLLKNFFHKEIRNNWLRTYIATDIIGAHPNGNSINEAIKASGLDIVGVFRSLLEEDIDGVIALNQTSTRFETQDALFGALKVLSSDVESAIEEPYEGEAMNLERISAFEGVLNPIITELGIGQVWARGIKDAYIDSILPEGAPRLDILDIASKIADSDFKEYAIAHVKDRIEREFNPEYSEALLERIEDTYQGDPFKFFAANELNNDSIRTIGDLDRRSQAFVTLPDELDLQMDRIISSSAGFLPDLPDTTQPDVRVLLKGRMRELAAQAGLSLEDYVEDRAFTVDLEAEFRESTEVYLSRLFPDEMMQDIIAINAEGSMIEFFSDNPFSGQTIEEITEAVRDFELDDPIPGESDYYAERRASIEDLRRKEEEDEFIEEQARIRALRDAEAMLTDEEYEADQARIEEDKRLADLAREERARRYDFEDPFSRAFERQANKFLFGPQGRAVAQDVGGLALQEFEERLNVTRDRVETDTGERPSFRQLFSGEFPEVGSIDQYVQREFDVDFFTESARKSRQSRTPAPRIGVGRRTNQATTPRLGAIGGR